MCAVAFPPHAVQRSSNKQARANSPAAAGLLIGWAKSGGALLPHEFLSLSPSRFCPLFFWRLPSLPGLRPRDTLPDASRPGVCVCHALRCPTGEFFFFGTRKQGSGDGARACLLSRELSTRTGPAPRCPSPPGRGRQCSRRERLTLLCVVFLVIPAVVVMNSCEIWKSSISTMAA